MSTFLELVQDLHREAGAAGSAPSSVVAQAGEAQRMVRWIRRADLAIQKKWHDWKFLWSSNQYSAATVSGTQDYVVPDTHGVWDESTFRIDGELIEVVEYQKVKHEVFDTSAASYNQPSRIIIMPNKTLRMDPIPDAAYTITADFYLKPVAMEADATISLIPEEYHEVILGQALVYYGNYENAPDAKVYGRELVAEWLPVLESEYLNNEHSSRHTASGNRIEVIAS